jgi:hypothetical protein
MSLLRQKEALMALYLAAREQMTAPFDFGSDWTEIRCGAFISGCQANDEAANANDDSAGFQNEDVDNAIYFGIKNSDSSALPGETDSLFIGVKPTGGNPSDNYSEWNAYDPPGVTVTTICDSAGSMSACGFAGTSLIDGGVITSPAGSGALRFKDYSAASGYCGLYVLRFVISNRGSASQSVSVSLASRTEVVGTDYSPFALQQEMNNASFGAAKTITWNTGASARTIPDAFFIRLPFFSNRLMIAAMRAIKYQPQ